MAKAEGLAKARRGRPEIARFQSGVFWLLIHHGCSIRFFMLICGLATD